MEEIWKDIKDYEGIYQVSNLGRVKSLSRKSRNWCGEITLKEKILSGSPNSHGYVQILLYKNSKKQQFRLHRVVAEHFISNPYNKKEVNHINGDKTDNRVENLEWATPSENTQHAHKNKLVKIKTGSEHHKARAINVFTQDGKLLKAYGSMVEACKEGYCKNSLRKFCLSGDLYKGFIWQYAT